MSYSYDAQKDIYEIVLKKALAFEKVIWQLKLISRQLKIKLTDNSDNKVFIVVSR